MILKLNQNYAKDANYNNTWDNSLKTATLLETIDLKKWVVIFPQQERRNAENFSKDLISLARNMGFNIDKNNSL